MYIIFVPYFSHVFLPPTMHCQKTSSNFWTFRWYKFFFFTLKALFLSVFFHSCRNQTRILPSNKIPVLCSYPCCDWAVFILHLTFPHLLVMMLLFTLESQETFEDNERFYLGVIAQYTCQIHFLRGEKRSAIKCGV